MSGFIGGGGGGSVAVGSITGLGTGVATALAVNVGTAGAPVVLNGALGTPSSGTLTNATGLPVSTGISGLGAGVATFLATPSSANLASAVTGETGSGALVFGTSPTISAPVLSALAEDFTADDTLTTAETGKTCTNNGASGQITLTLPAATGSRNWYEFVCVVAQNIVVDAAGTDTIQNSASASSAGGTMTAGATGRVARIMDVASGKWFVTSVVGSWTMA